MNLFISYRRSDAPSAARQLAEALKVHFGDEEVFFDTRDVAAGTEWRTGAVQRVQAADIVLVIIGPHWLAAAEHRARRGVLDPTTEDVVRLEIETSFTHGAVVMPVLVDDAEMPPREALPRPFRPLADVQAQTLHHTTWGHDLELLIEALDHLAVRPRAREEAGAAPVARPSSEPRTDAERIACYVIEGSVVTVLGSGVNAVDRNGSWEQGAGLPDNAELARHLAGRFHVGSETDDLARISQCVSLTEGKVDLYRTLRELLIKAEGAPSSAHSFIARLPGRLRDLDREAYQLVITTSYDTALERAFDAVHEPYDLAVFVASGEHRGRFVHVPWWDPGDDGPRPITVPNEYVDLPIDEDGELARTVIVKLHGGAVNLGARGPHLRDNFVITEDDYIGYLTQGPVSSLIPLQILNKIRDSHFLFLGYRMRDWTLRVFLQRVWGEQQLEARSWAVDPEREAIERGLWEHFGVNIVEESATEFLNELERELGRVAGAHVER